MLEFFFFMALLFQCGLFPMGPSDCTAERKVETRPSVSRVFPVESP